MSNGIAAKLTLVALASLATGFAATEPEGPAAQAVMPHSASVRYQVDAARGRVWRLEGDEVHLDDVKRRQRITLKLPDWHWAGAPYGCPPDLALGPKGEVVVTSDVLPMLWRIDPETLAVSVHSLALDADADKDVGFSALTYSTKHGAYFAVSAAHGSLWKIDPLLRRAQKTPLAAEAAKTCGLALWSRAGSGRQMISAASSGTDMEVAI